MDYSGVFIHIYKGRVIKGQKVTTNRTYANRANLSD